ncbi:hypothetical protein CWI38_0095p0020 [Hamiltosporidium tvaerminnensis]|uniref:Uncharacterized protein n=1 Tax=Hamiltosporidium tvaerminnensis TaxID=1176355 RepID=A0A4Q9M3J9_9MICR|nr:hypothetical protein CWI38_0095p0020 [Hamiltosporidium tvaerminnensis]
MFLLNGISYTVNDLNEKLMQMTEKIYRCKEKTLRSFSDSDFYDIELETPTLSSEMNQLICDYITSSVTKKFNIFLEYVCNKYRATYVPNNTYFFTLSKLKSNSFLFGIKYKNNEDVSLPGKKIPKVWGKKSLKYLLNCLFSVSLIFRKLYPDLIGSTGLSYKYSFDSYRFMIFDSEFCFENIIALPNKRLISPAYFIRREKNVFSTKLKVSGKLPVSHPMNDVDLIFKKSFNMFSTLKGKYRIKAAWRFGNNSLESEHEKKFNLTTFYTRKIQLLFNNYHILNSEFLSIKEYISSFKFTSSDSSDSSALPVFEREFQVHFNWQKFSYSVQFVLNECDEFTRKYTLVFNIFENYELECEVVSDNKLNIIDIVKNFKTRSSRQNYYEPTDHDIIIMRIFEELICGENNLNL